MSNRRFIEVSSAHRNRNQYPNPSQFDIPFSPSRSLNQNQTIKGVYLNTTTNNSATLYTQSIDVADTVTSGIVENYWYGNNGVVDSGIVTTTVTSSSSPITISISGLTNTITAPTVGFYISINNSIVGTIITPPAPTTTSVTFSVEYPSISLATPLTIQAGSTFVILNSTVEIDDSTLQTAPPTSTVSSFYVNVSTLKSPYKNIPNFYVGYLLQATTGAGLTCAGIINSYNPSTGLISVEIPLLTTQVITSGGAIKIIDPSNYTSSPVSITSGGVTYVCPANTLVLPLIDANGKYILSYDQCYNNYYVVYETPIYSTPSTTSIVSSKIVSYNFLTNTATLGSPLSSSLLTPITSITMNRYSIRKTLPNQVFTTVSTGTSLPQFQNMPIIYLNNCIFLPSSANNNDNYYTGQYIYVYPNQTANNQITSLSNIEGSCYYINSYVSNNGATNACFVSLVTPPNVTSPTQYYPSYSSNITNFPSPGTVINIVNFANDNYNPLIYNGSVVSQNETVAYEISLVNLTLPNITLITGSRAAFYPYLYVELSNVTASSSSSKNVIYSNNPNSGKALFLVPITDITDPLRSPFIKLDAGSMVQTVKFKPNDCLRFSVFLPNGELYLTVMSDYYTPSGPNPMVQIDALFGIKRLTGV